MIYVKNCENNAIDVVEGNEKTISENGYDIMINGKVTYKTITRLLSNLQDAEFDYAKDPKIDTINVFINCNDCDFKSAISIYSVLKASNLKINTFIDDKALGYSLLIFLAGENRYMTDRSYIKIRNSRILKSYEKYDKYFKEKERNNYKLLFEVEILSEILKYETFLSPEKIDELIFCDKILHKRAMEYRISTGVFRWNR